MANQFSSRALSLSMYLMTYDSHYLEMHCPTQHVASKPCNMARTTEKN